MLPRSIAVVSLVLAATLVVTAQQTFDLVILGGRVIDPESGLDATRNVGIADDRITAVSGDALQGHQTLDASGLVVAPGFIDIHRHAHGDNSYRYAARDGVTSVFELEIGTADVDGWYHMLGPARLINFGVGAGHIGARMQVLGDKGFLLPTGPGRGPATATQIAEIVSLVQNGLDQGAVAAGMGTAYTPGASLDELTAVIDTAMRHGAFVHAHLSGDREELQNVLGRVGKLVAAIHIAHINSTAGREIRAWLQTVEDARKSGVDVTTELYPYTAGATLIQSALYDGWEKWPNERFQMLQWAATGERLTRETFATYRAQGGSVISHSNTEEMLRVSVADPRPIISSDGGRDAADEPTHPRASGTFARVLGHYVRDEKVLTLQDALRRMTIEPARRLERRVPEMRDRGRIRVGAFADITVFDPATVRDRSTYADAAEFSEGIVHVIVNGVPIVRSGAFADRGMIQGQRILLGTRMPGRPIRAPRKGQ